MNFLVVCQQIRFGWIILCQMFTYLIVLLSCLVRLEEVHWPNLFDDMLQENLLTVTHFFQYGYCSEPLYTTSYIVAKGFLHVCAIYIHSIDHIQDLFLEPSTQQLEPFKLAFPCSAIHIVKLVQPYCTAVCTPVKNVHAWDREWVNVHADTMFLLMPMSMSHWAGE